MKVGLILHPYGEKMAAGLGRSILSMARSIITQDNNADYTVFLKGYSVPKPNFLTKNWTVIRLPKIKFWLDIGLYLSPPMDVYVFFSPVLPLFFKMRKSILVVHDLGYLSLPSKNIFQRINRLIIKLVHGRSIKRVSRVIAISEYTRDQVIKYFPFSEDKISVVLNGFEKIDFEDMERVDLPAEDFFLFVGVLKERKNPLRIIEAFNIFKKKTKSKSILVFAGRNDNDQVSRAILSSSYSRDIICLGYVNVRQLAFLYRNAKALIFPSLLEGFGLPILEAMSAGLPVITSNFGAMKEVAGDAGILVDPYSVESMASAIEVVLDINKKNELTIKGLARSKMFSWSESGRNYIKIIHEIT